MRFEHPAHPGRAVRLAYCLNLHPAEDLDGFLDGLRTITLPLAARLDPARASGGFGIGPWLPARVAHALASDADALASLTGFLAEHQLDPFTFNAFPFGGFHRERVKESVFRPTWRDRDRLKYTLDVARVALGLRAARPLHERDGVDAHLSISTHAGAFGAWIRDEAELDAYAYNLARFAGILASLEQQTGTRVILSVEPEPRSVANDTAELARLFERVRSRADADSRGALARHLGACLDACHAAVEFEEPETAVANATARGAPLGKLQFSSALALRDPADADGEAVDLLLAMDEPVYLHQVTGRPSRAGGGFLRVTDLPELRAAWERGDAGWRDSPEWRCHFHVPVDLEAVGARLGTTRAEADALLAAALARPQRWGTRELHVEIETYTWNVLPEAARGPGRLVDGLEREMRHVLARLDRAGWRAPRAG